MTTDPSHTPDELDVLCEACGYSLIGITTSTCPECGRSFDPGDLPLARVPWLHRRKLGAANAYLRTVAMILLTPRKFVRELSRPVRISPLDAQRFRQLTVRIAAISGAVTAMAAVPMSINFPSPWVEPWPTVLLLAGVVVVYFAARMFLRLATDMPVFIWDNLPGMRAFDLTPVQHYACAPMALAPLILPAGLPVLLLFHQRGWSNTMLTIAAVASGCVLAIWLILCWLMPMILMRAAARAGPVRLAIFGMYLPFHYVAMAAVIGAVFVALAGFVAFIAGIVIKLLSLS
jgi:hypothetical protein